MRSSLTLMGSCECACGVGAIVVVEDVRGLRVEGCG
jgi:hypothetical protein